MLRIALSALGLLSAATSLTATAGIEVLGTVELSGSVHEAADLSGVVARGEALLVVSDEDARIQVLDPVKGQAAYRAREEPILLLDEDEEIDLEGLASRDSMLYAVGSHSLVRRRLDPGLPAARNHERLSAVVHRPARDRLFRLRVDAMGVVAGEIESVSLRELLERDPLLSPFSRIPGKENGVDIEGLAVRGDRLYLGFRSPRLRSGHVPVLVLRFDEPDAYELRLVDLGGLGIRDLAEVHGGFLVLAGPGRDDEGSAVFFWDGRDQLPGSDRNVTPAVRLGEFPAPEGAASEGIAVLRETAAHIDAIVVHDGSTTATLVRIARRP